MLARTRGPARNPVWAATKSRAPAETRVRATRTGPMAKLPSVQSPKTRCAKTAFIVRSGTGRAPTRR